MPTYKFYKDTEKTILDPTFVDQTAQDYSKKLKETDNLNPNQLRKFYHEFKRIERIIEMQVSQSDKELKFKEQYPFIKLIKSKATYAKESGHVKDNFLEFINSGVNSINDLKDFSAFLIFFEAVVGYFKKN